MSDSCDTTYDDLIATLFSLRKPREREAGFAGMQRYAEHLGNPHRRYRTIHIAGTDGKGSVAHKIAHALSESGYRTGLFTSPHLFRYRERVTIDGEMIAEEEVASLLRRLFRLVREPRFFEVTTLLAFSYFAEKGVEVAVIETGIGGRFDMTNIIRPILTIITSIGFDHEEILGRTRDEIATEKGGIIKEGVPLIVGPDADLPLLRDKAKEKGASYTVAKKRGLGREAESIALEAFVILRHRYSIPRSAALAGSRKRAPLRFERVCDGVIVDTAHNRGGISRLFALLRKTFPGQPIRLLFACAKHRDPDPMIEVLARNVSETVLFRSRYGALCDPYAIRESLLRSGNGHVRHTLFSDGDCAWGYLMHTKRAGTLIVIAGSFHMMREISFLADVTLRRT